MSWFKKKKTEKRGLVYVKPYSDGLFFGKYSKKTHLTLSAVFAAVEMISNAIAELPIKVKQTAVNDIQVIDHHYFERLFYTLKMSKFNFIKQLVWDMMLHGNGYAYIKRDSKGNPIDLIYLKESAVSIQSIPEKDTLYYIVSGYTNVPGRVERTDMIHIYKNSNDGYVGRGLLSYAQRAMDLSNYTESAAEDYFSSGCNVKGILKFSRGIVSDEQKEAIRSSWQQVHGSGESTSGLAVLEGDADFIPVSQNAADSQMIESRVFNIQEIARFFCISPVLLQDLSHSSYSTVEAMNLQFVQYTLMPYIELIEDEFNRKLVYTAPSYMHDNLYIDLDESALMKGNKTDMANYASTLVSNGIMSINEARQFFGLNPKQGCDDLFIPYTDINQNKINQDENQQEKNQNEL